MTTQILNKFFPNDVTRLILSCNLPDKDIVISRKKEYIEDISNIHNYGMYFEEYANRCFRKEFFCYLYRFEDYSIDKVPVNRIFTIQKIAHIYLLDNLSHKIIPGIEPTKILTYHMDRGRAIIEVLK